MDANGFEREPEVDAPNGNVPVGRFRVDGYRPDVGFCGLVVNWAISGHCRDRWPFDWQWGPARLRRLVARLLDSDPQHLDQKSALVDRPGRISCSSFGLPVGRVFPGFADRTLVIRNVLLDFFDLQQFPLAGRPLIFRPLFLKRGCFCGSTVVG